MPFRCLACNAVASIDIRLVCCSSCHSALYCSPACQKTDWKQHKQICKLLNPGWGAMQVKYPIHDEVSADIDEAYEGSMNIHRNEDSRTFFKLFLDSTLEESKAAAREMEKILNRQIPAIKYSWLLQSMYLLLRGGSEKLTWPNSPLLVALRHGVDPDIYVSQDGSQRETILHMLARCAHAEDVVTHRHQLILARQLIEHGANVNAVSAFYDYTPLHFACLPTTITNLGFIKFLLEHGANQNMLSTSGKTPLLLTAKVAPAAAKFLIEWPGTDVNHVAHSTGISSLALVRVCTTYFTMAVEPKNRFILKQWREIEAMLVEMGANDTGVRL
jgi:ankyrin repeat protein